MTLLRNPVVNARKITDLEDELDHWALQIARE